MCEPKVKIAEAWGDAPPLITCPSACTDSEKSIALRRLHSFPIRLAFQQQEKKDHEPRSKQRGLMRTPSISPFPLAKLAPDLSRRDSRSSLHESAYFTSCPPSAPLALMVRASDRVVDIVHASTSTTCIEKTTPYYAGIRNLVEEIADTAVNEKSDIQLGEMNSDTCSLNMILCSSPESRSSPVMRKRFRRHSVAVTRNVAVQAISSKVKQEGHYSKNATGTELEWVGGVRALRDSHVRHVLRQLKHIERLNRALDRVHHSETD